MTATETVSQLAGSFDPDRPGLPRGRAKLAAEEIRDAHRNRILRATIAATADKGIRATTLADIVGRARVSRQAFYQQFESKEACLIAAIDHGIVVVLAAIEGVVQSTLHMPARQQLSAIVETYLQTCDEEPEFARAWVMDLPLAGDAGLAKRNDYLALVADALRDIYATRWGRDDVPAPEAFLAAIGGCYELFYRHTIARDQPYRALGDPIIDFLGRFLQLPEGGADSRAD